jgi:iron complex transport system substrate-binding protein
MKLNRIRYVVLVLLAVLLNACKNNVQETKTDNLARLSGLKKDTTIKYARRFSISENEFVKVVYLFGHVDIKDTAAIYVIPKDGVLIQGNESKTFYLSSFCKKIASLSSVYTSMLCEVGEVDHIVAIENIDYYTNKTITDKFSSGELQELCKGPKLDVEKTVALNPDILFTFGMGNPEKSINQKIVKAGIPMVVTVDHLEETPLARAEWIKFFAAFTNKKQQADSIFDAVEKNYYLIKKIAAELKSKPTVFSEIKFGEIWYVPGGKSFAATFFNDANANYIWKDNDKTGSLHLSFEEVYVKAKEADYWLNMALVTSKQELIAQEPRYAQFNAFKEGKMYNNIKTMNNKGYSDYWETGIIYPNKVLHDLVRIFHPELEKYTAGDLYYYKKLD